MGDSDYDDDNYDDGEEFQKKKVGQAIKKLKIKKSGKAPGSRLQRSLSAKSRKRLHSSDSGGVRILNGRYSRRQHAPFPIQLKLKRKKYLNNI
ncbi:hypothetical protein KP79_PYT16908 [Mizuhopecten yessoensis]|uniref:Uncharacterized protein n=1 Tax=Mizuhopecten yessoensis TaxID=6573 RepID=A0A210QRP9_MIZYE|nr:hypothetical protein KP79_PYT16908 [Mizuhopecten yessoensis]